MWQNTFFSLADNLNDWWIWNNTSTTSSWCNHQGSSLHVWVLTVNCRSSFNSVLKHSLYDHDRGEGYASVITGESCLEISHPGYAHSVVFLGEKCNSLRAPFHLGEVGRLHWTNMPVLNTQYMYGACQNYEQGRMLYFANYLPLMFSCMIK